MNFDEREAREVFMDDGDCTERVKSLRHFQPTLDRRNFCANYGKHLEFINYYLPY